MLMLSFEMAIGDGNHSLPAHLGGVLHGFFEGAVKEQAPHLLPVLRPGGDNKSAHFMILSPPMGQAIEHLLRFGVMLYGVAAEAWPVLVRALVVQQLQQINNRNVRIRLAWLQQPGNPAQALMAHGRLLDVSPPILEAPGTLYRRIYAEQPPTSARRIHTLTFRSPLLLASRKAQRDRLPATGALPCPTLGSLLDSIAQRMRELEPGLAEMTGLPPAWIATKACRSIEALTSAADPARPVNWDYFSTPRANAAAPPPTHRRLRLPGIGGVLSYPASNDELEHALLYWGQWLGVGQKTTMGCGSYVLTTC